MSFPCRSCALASWRRVGHACRLSASSSGPSTSATRRPSGDVGAGADGRHRRPKRACSKPSPSRPRRTSLSSWRTAAWCPLASGSAASWKMCTRRPAGPPRSSRSASSATLAPSTRQRLLHWVEAPTPIPRASSPPASSASRGRAPASRASSWALRCRACSRMRNSGSMTSSCAPTGLRSRRRMSGALSTPAERYLGRPWLRGRSFLPPFLGYYLTSCCMSLALPKPHLLVSPILRWYSPV
mmetsp:Transcript_48661/g.150762  ORF Transcript_48661/g.150762 Transcript_48661/m.150762 type:complete len:241 (+) Transcript_48661:189-911(+)